MSGKITYHGPAKSLPDFPTKGSSLPVLTQNQRSQKGPASGRTARLQEGRCIKGPGQGHKNLNIADFCVKKFSVSGEFFVSKICIQKRPPKWPTKKDSGASAGESWIKWKPCPLSGSPAVPKSPQKPQKIVKNRLKSGTRRFLRISRIKTRSCTQRMATRKAAGGSRRSGLRSKTSRRPWLVSKAVLACRKVTRRPKTSTGPHVHHPDKILRCTYKMATVEAAGGSRRSGLRVKISRRPWLVSKAVLASRKVTGRPKTSTGPYVRHFDKIPRCTYKMATMEAAGGPWRSGLRSLTPRRPWLVSKAVLASRKMTGRSKAGAATYACLYNKTSSCTYNRASREAPTGSGRLAAWSMVPWRPSFSSEAVLLVREVSKRPEPSTGQHTHIPIQVPFLTSKIFAAAQGGTKPLPLRKVAGVGLLEELKLKTQKKQINKKSTGCLAFSGRSFGFGPRGMPAFTNNTVLLVGAGVRCGLDLRFRLKRSRSPTHSKLKITLIKNQSSTHLNPAVELVCLLPRRGSKRVKLQNEAST